jgi:hypothetical protein
MKYILLISSGLLLLLVAIVLVLSFRDCPHLLRRLSRTLLHLKYVPAADIKFRSKSMTFYNSMGPHGSTSDGSAVESSDCVTVGWAIYRFPTASDAEAQFRDWEYSASRIIEGTGSGDEPGSQEATLEINDKNDFRSRFNIILMKTNSNSILSIWSRSLEHALLFEQGKKEVLSGQKSRGIGNDSTTETWKEPHLSFCS